MSQSWYKRRGRLAKKNEGRKECAIAKQKKTFEENICTLKDDCDKKNPSWNNKKKLEMINVGEYSLQHGPFVPTQEVDHLLGQTITDLQNSKTKRTSSEILKSIQRYFNVIQIYIMCTGYILENRHYDSNEVA